MKECRCSKCNKKLYEYANKADINSGSIEIKAFCTRCKTENITEYKQNAESVID